MQTGTNATKRGALQAVRKPWRRLKSWLRRSFGAKSPAASRVVAEPVDAKSLIARSGLFDPAWYLEKYPDVRAAGLDALDHYLGHGGEELRWPGPRFDPRWYRQTSEEARAPGCNPLLHYLTVGRAAGVQLPEAEEPLSERPEIKDLLASALFDADWYRRHRAGLPKGREHVAHHYLTEGWREGLQPGPHFDGEAYLKRYADVAEADVNPLLHYIRHGHAEGRAISASPKAAPKPTRPSDDDGPLIDPTVEWRWTEGDALQTVAPRRGRLRLGQLLLGATTSDRIRDVIHAFQSLCGTARRSPADRPFVVESDRDGLVADAWFITATDLRIRLRPGAGGAVVARAYQIDPAVGRPVRTTETALNWNEMPIFDARLSNSFAPVLVCLDDGAGALLAAAMIPFPSLGRHGAHHGELAAAGAHQHLVAYGAGLAKRLLADEGPPLSIGRVEISLAGAIGGEAGLGRDLHAWCAGVMGIKLQPIRRSAPSKMVEPLLEGLEGRRAPLRRGLSRAGGLTLRLGADMAPSISALVDRSSEVSDGDARPCPVVIADVVRARPRWCVHPPADSAHLLAIATARGAPPWPVLTGSGLTSDAPVAIRFMDDIGRGEDAARAFPVASDVKQIVRGADLSKRYSVSVILDLGDDEPDAGDVGHSLGSIIEQQAIAVSDMILTSPTAQPDALAIARGLHESAVSVTDPRGAAARLNAAAASARGDFLLFLRPSVLMHDARTLSLLCSIAQEERVATVGCAMLQPTLAGQTGRALAELSCGLFPAAVSLDGGAQVIFDEPAAAAALPPAAFAVAANRFRLAVVPRQAWERVGPLNGVDYPDAEFDLDFALRAIATGHRHVCTSVVTALHTAAVPAKQSSIKVDALTASDWIEVLGRITTLRRLT